jgi:hypothetical protein
MASFTRLVSCSELLSQQSADLAQEWDQYHVEHRATDGDNVVSLSRVTSHHPEPILWHASRKLSVPTLSLEPRKVLPPSITPWALTWVMSQGGQCGAL